MKMKMAQKIKNRFDKNKDANCDVVVPQLISYSLRGRGVFRSIYIYFEKGVLKF